MPGLLAQCRFNDALIDAASLGDLNKIKYLVALGAEIKSGNNVALKWAIHHGHLDAVKYLVSQGADFTDQADKGEYFIRWADKWVDQDNRTEIMNFLQLFVKTDKLSKMLVEGMLKDV
jgi:ankyrin repeat protein